MITTISVTKFNSIVRDIFNNEELLHSVNVCGEVFGVSRAKTAIYFSIKDEESSLPCVCFNLSAFEGISEGDLVTLYGGPNFYTKIMWHTELNTLDKAFYINDLSNLKINWKAKDFLMQARKNHCPRPLKELEL